MKKKKVLFIILFCFFIIFLIFGYGVVINKKVQEDRLLRDVEMFASKDILNDRKFSFSSVSFQYKEVEDYIEDYIDEFYKQYQIVMSYANDQELITLLSVSNYLEDGKEFYNSFGYLDDIRIRFQKDIDKLLTFCTKSGIIEFSNKISLSNYYQDIFVDSVMDSSLFIKLKQYKSSFLESENRMNNIFNTITDVLVFLKSNPDDWKVEDNQIQFSTDDFVNHYNFLVSNIQ